RVGDDRVRDACRFELPGGQAGALQEWPGLVDPDLFEQAEFPRGPKRADRAPVAAGRKASRVAMGQRTRARTEQLRGVRGHRAATPDFVLVQGARAGWRG